MRGRVREGDLEREALLIFFLEQMCSRSLALRSLSSLSLSLSSTPTPFSFLLFFFFASTLGNRFGSTQKSTDQIKKQFFSSLPPLSRSLDQPALLAHGEDQGEDGDGPDRGADARRDEDGMRVLVAVDEVHAEDAGDGLECVMVFSVILSSFSALETEKSGKERAEEREKQHRK